MLKLHLLGEPETGSSLQFGGIQESGKLLALVIAQANSRRPIKDLIRELQTASASGIDIRETGTADLKLLLVDQFNGFVALNNNLSPGRKNPQMTNRVKLWLAQSDELLEARLEVLSYVVEDENTTEMVAAILQQL